MLAGLQNNVFKLGKYYSIFVDCPIDQLYFRHLLCCGVFSFIGKIKLKTSK